MYCILKTIILCISKKRFVIQKYDYNTGKYWMRVWIKKGLKGKYDGNSVGIFGDILGYLIWGSVR